MTMRRRAVLKTGLVAPALLSATGSAAMAQHRGRVVRSVPIGDLPALDPTWARAYIRRSHA